MAYEVIVEEYVLQCVITYSNSVKGDPTSRARRKRYNPWEDWALGGPLAVKYQVSIIPEAHEGPEGTEMSQRWRASVYYRAGEHYGTEYCDAALIATCQAVVATEFGDTVQVPKELLT
ncbi:phage protein NinX family protein [Pseudomonas vlassakiae]|uniref:phage protein NinX family protein n=1 Tax=Pseudomonas vlassakiae TaxID=485888 RepID=UPI003D2D948F